MERLAFNVILFFQFENGTEMRWGCSCIVAVVVHIVSLTEKYGIVRTTFISLCCKGRMVLAVKVEERHRG